MGKQQPAEDNGRRAVQVDIHEVNKRFNDQIVLNDVSFTIDPGEIFIIMGPSGAGKSTLMRAIVNLEKIDSGEIRINGQDAFKQQT
ncbi:MAG: ATP-binding cassette domain-containing protein, partial [Verrucomicrobiota bacterium]